MLDGGHAVNALPQTAGAMVNCRVLPDTKPEEVLATLKRVVADDQVSITVAARNGRRPAIAAAAGSSEGGHGSATPCGREF